MSELEKIEKDISGITERLSSLESVKQSKSRFFFQYLFTPILVVLLGAIFNFQLEDKKSEMKQFELANSMLPKIFSDDPHISLATQKILDSVLKDEKLKSTIQKIVNDNLKEKVRIASNKQQPAEIESILNAAESFNSPIKTELTKYQEALKNERLGFTLLVDKDYKGAIAAFDKVEGIYPSFHQVYEISKLLKENENALGDNKTRREVVKTIVNDLSWKAPPKELNMLMTELGGK